MKLKINLKLIWLFAGLWIVALIAMVYAQTTLCSGTCTSSCLCKSQKNTTIRITAVDGSGDWSIINSSSNRNYFVPNKKIEEWAAFIKACTTPPGLAGLTCTNAGGGGAVCPDGACNGGETCLSCPQDCGACPPVVCTAGYYTAAYCDDLACNCLNAKNTAPSCASICSTTYNCPNGAVDGTPSCQNVAGWCPPPTGLCSACCTSLSYWVQTCHCYSN